MAIYVFTAICNGECGSSHPHSKIYDEATTTFQITGTSENETMKIDAVICIV
jgi:hypothetical protein